MTEYNHVLIVSAETAESISDGMIAGAKEHGVGVVVSDENGLTALSEELNPQELERLGNVLPRGVNANKANGVLHKLAFRINNVAQSTKGPVAKDGDYRSY